MRTLLIILAVFILSGCTIKPVFVINLASVGVIVSKQTLPKEANECIQKWIEHRKQTRDIDKALEEMGKERK